MYKLENMPKSIKIALISFFVILLFLIGMKMILKQDKLVYLKISTIKNKEKLVGKQWIDLDGRWYSKDIDDSTFAQMDVDDKKWQSERYIYIGQVKGGKGPKWFRKHFVLNKKPFTDTILLRLSLFDTQNQVYLNGYKIADSGFVYNKSICFKAPSSLLKKGRNVIAVRAKMNIHVSGTVSNFKDEIIVKLQPKINLEGQWRFKAADIYEAKNINFDDSKWQNLYVPRKWDLQGYADYNGIGWYRNGFVLPNDLKDKELIFIGGRIDDFHEIYINETKIGGNVFKKHNLMKSDDWETFVIYRINKSLLRDTNIVAIRVNDYTLDGGIYEGPVGILDLNTFYDFFKK